jgi:hypothetical protein
MRPIDSLTHTVVKTAFKKQEDNEELLEKVSLLKNRYFIFIFKLLGKFSLKIDISCKKILYFQSI